MVKFDLKRNKTKTPQCPPTFKCLRGAGPFLSERRLRGAQAGRSGVRPDRAARARNTPPDFRAARGQQSLQTRGVGSETPRPRLNRDDFPETNPVNGGPRVAAQGRAARGRGSSGAGVPAPAQPSPGGKLPVARGRSSREARARSAPLATPAFRSVCS